MTFTFSGGQGIVLIGAKVKVEVLGLSVLFFSYNLQASHVIKWCISVLDKI